MLLGYGKVFFIANHTSQSPCKLNFQCTIKK
jgi:hypothetical protein